LASEVFTSREVMDVAEPGGAMAEVALAEGNGFINEVLCKDAIGRRRSRFPGP